jgi:hypothetical protein
MSDWIDLQLAHSLTRTKAPDELWSRIQSGALAPTQPRRVRWAFPVAVAACALLLLARLAAFELHTPTTGFSPVENVAVERWAAHQPGSGSVWNREPMQARSDCRLCHNL